MNIEPREYVLVPMGSYSANVLSVEEAEGQYGPQLRWLFDLGEVKDVEGYVQDRTLVGYTSQVLSAKSKLWSWCLAVGLNPADGVATEDIAGRAVVLEVGVKQRKNGDGEYNAILGLRPATGRSAVVSGMDYPHTETVAAPAADSSDDIPF